MLSADGRAWLVVGCVEAVFAVANRLAVAQFGIYTVEAEAIRTALRLLAVWAYWRWLRDRLRSEPIDGKALARPVLVLPVLVWLSYPPLCTDFGDHGRAVQAIFFATSLVVGMKEEITFRALIQPLLQKHVGEAKAILLTSVLFVAYHLGTVPVTFLGYANIMIAGLLLGVVFARTGSLWLVIGLHSVFDALATLAPVLDRPLPPVLGMILTFYALLVLIRAKWSRR